MVQALVKATCCSPKSIPVVSTPSHLLVSAQVTMTGSTVRAEKPNQTSNPLPPQSAGSHWQEHCHGLSMSSFPESKHASGEKHRVEDAVESLVGTTPSVDLTPEEF